MEGKRVMNNEVRVTFNKHKEIDVAIKCPVCRDWFCSSNMRHLSEFGENWPYPEARTSFQKLYCSACVREKVKMFLFSQ